MCKWICLSAFMMLAHDCDAVAVTTCSVSWLCFGATVHLWHHTVRLGTARLWVARLWLLSLVAYLVSWIYVVSVPPLSLSRVCCRWGLHTISEECKHLINTSSFILAATHLAGFELFFISSLINSLQLLIPVLSSIINFLIYFFTLQAEVSKQW